MSDQHEIRSVNPAVKKLRMVNGRVRARVVADREMRESEQLAYEEADEDDIDVSQIPRPRSRGECLGGERPCPWAGCKYHTYLDVNPETGSLKLNYPHLEVWEIPETCALDVADRGGATLQEVGRMFGLTRERIRQIEVRGLAILRGGACLTSDMGADGPEYNY